MFRNSILYLVLGILMPLSPLAAASSHAQDYSALLAAPDRTDADRQNDKKREAEKLLTFIGPKPGWRVLDMAAGAGYSTELMARAVAPGGKVYGQNDKASEKLAARMKTSGMANATEVILPFDNLSDPELHDLDLVTFLFGYHDTTFMAVDRAKMDKALFNALKPGGLLIVADHSARPEDGATVGKTLHRIAEKTLRDEIEGAGFKFVADADFLRHPEDTRTNIVFKNPTPNDEFLLKFRRP